MLTLAITVSEHQDVSNSGGMPAATPLCLYASMVQRLGNARKAGYTGLPNALDDGARIRSKECCPRTERIASHT